MKNFEKCEHVIEVGQMAVYVTPGCPNSHLIKGILATTKRRCNKCTSCNRKGKKEMHQRHQKKSEGAIARIKNTNSAIKHRDKKAEEWMKRKPYGGMTKHEQNAKQETTDKK